MCVRARARACFTTLCMNMIINVYIYAIDLCTSIYALHDFLQVVERCESLKAL